MGLIIYGYKNRFIGRYKGISGVGTSALFLGLLWGVCVYAVCYVSYVCNGSYSVCVWILSLLLSGILPLGIFLAILFLSRVSEFELV